MRISRIEIHNFRNFADCDFDVGENAVIVGENKIGKSNLIFALRLILDPSLPDSERQLKKEDFWDGLDRPLKKEDFISISVCFADFENNTDQLSTLSEYLIAPEPMVAKLTYLFRPIPALTENPKKDSDYEFVIYGGNQIDNIVQFPVKKWIPLDVLQALRNTEEDLANRRRSPLVPLLTAIAGDVDQVSLEEIAKKIDSANKEASQLDPVKILAENIQKRLEKMVGPQHGVDTSLGFSPAAPESLLRSLRLLIDGGRRGIGDASLGSSNLIYLSLLLLNLKRKVLDGTRYHTFLAIEEPEAHLHPHLQRLAFRDFLGGAKNLPRTVIVTTHSPHIVSITPLKSIVLLKKSANGSTEASSAFNLKLSVSILADLERYIDVNRGEILFAKGILLVEGIAEKFIVPAMAKNIGIDFDELGITVCSIEGTNFEPYVHLLGKEGLNIPFAILTDLDEKDGKKLGEERILRLLNILEPNLSKKSGSNNLLIAKSFGLFLNNSTLEVELFKSGEINAIVTTMNELSENAKAKERIAQWMKDPIKLDTDQFIKDISDIGKGRFAQRLAAHLSTSVPLYIKEANHQIIAKIGRTKLSFIDTQSFTPRVF